MRLPLARILKGVASMVLLFTLLTSIAPPVDANPVPAPTAQPTSTSIFYDTFDDFRSDIWYTQTSPYSYSGGTIALPHSPTSPYERSSNT